MILRGVLLDLDGTLVDHEGAVSEALLAWLPTIGVPATAATVRLWFEAQDRHLPAWRSREITFAEQRRRRLRDFLPRVGVTPPGDDPGLDELFDGYLHHYEGAWRAYDDVDAALESVARAGLRTAVLTNGSTRQQHDKLARVGLLGRVGPVWTAEDLSAAKPDPAAFHAACRRWGRAPHEVLHVGDDHALDVRAARHAGLHAVHLDRTGAGPTDEPCRITTLAGLAALLSGEPAGGAPGNPVGGAPGGALPSGTDAS